MREATPADRPAIEATLRARMATSLFPLSNLLTHGMAGGHPRAMRFWLGPRDAVLGLTGAGVAMPQVPPERMGAAARALSGHPLAGIIGEAAQVAALRSALGLDGAATTLDSVEPHFALDLHDLRIPDTARLSLRPLSAAPRDLVTRWREGYGRETLGWGDDVPVQAEADVAAQLAAGRHRALFRGADPVAVTGFNAQVDDVVQVGGVWTPRDLRNRGFARAAVALHLVEAQEAGAARAILFAASGAAARAYRALGFQRVGDFALLLFAAPVTAGA